jgi:hypothetical protein
MPYHDKSKRREAVQRLRTKRRASGLCPYCGQPLKKASVQPKPVPVKIPVPMPRPVVVKSPEPMTNVIMVKCLSCRRAVPRAELDLRGHCPRCL